VPIIVPSCSSDVYIQDLYIVKKKRLWPQEFSRTIRTILKEVWIIRKRVSKDDWRPKQKDDEDAASSKLKVLSSILQMPRYLRVRVSFETPIQATVLNCLSNMRRLD